MCCVCVCVALAAKCCYVRVIMKAGDESGLKTLLLRSVCVCVCVTLYFIFISGPLASACTSLLSARLTASHVLNTHTHTHRPLPFMCCAHTSRTHHCTYTHTHAVTHPHTATLACLCSVLIPPLLSSLTFSSQLHVVYLFTGMDARQIMMSS